jgi:hypothetical protein
VLSDHTTITALQNAIVNQTVTNTTISNTLTTIETDIASIKSTLAAQQRNQPGN